MLKQPTASISSNFPHMLLASYITGAFCVAATGAFLCHQGDTLIH
jgi:cytochrome bd-type quinol oxidase subunit 1